MISRAENGQKRNFASNLVFALIANVPEQKRSETHRLTDKINILLSGQLLGLAAIRVHDVDVHGAVPV